MNLKELLSNRKETIINKWFDLIIDSYPPDTAHFLRTQKNQFTNPVGHTIHNAIEGILDELLEPSDSAKLTSHLDSIIRIRAIQGFTPSVALNFLFLLKKVVRDEIQAEAGMNGVAEELLGFESQVDGLLKESFDIYMACREKLYELSANEARNMTYRLLESANLLKDSSETFHPEGDGFDSG
jgi:hypothetical protein